ncbi:heparinase II/III family protein [Bacillus cereus]|uniref:alginate lyase family protein n=1 Tax=Bacillus cereus TaxID=1396 RepID=UPI001122AF40|nr:alginate lyase family protein [Bacillus cereus]UDW03304.1 heparinase II/III family protein [Bacillus cereus]
MYLKKIKGLSPKEIVVKIKKKTFTTISKEIKCVQDNLYPSYSKKIYKYELENIFLDPIEYEFTDFEIKQIKETTSLYLKHYFDLLGSGWTKVQHNIECRGLGEYRYIAKKIESNNVDGLLRNLVNKKNIPYSKYVRSKISDNYLPIDWRIDFKSGYCWDSRKHSSKLSFGKQPGVDIKVPWELSRMQHLVQFVWAYKLAKQGNEGFASPYVYVREFQDEILDFISTNPPKFGVNWTCTMDVAIRAANWLLVYDLFKVQGVEFDKEFEKIFVLSIHDHGNFIFNNLERNKDIRNNHYLSNIVGLFFIATYLPATEVVSQWLNFSFQELIQEMSFQFYEEGSNFENSTTYHRLSSELMLYATTVALALPEEKIKVLHSYRLQNHIEICKKLGFEIDSDKFWDFHNGKTFPNWYIERLEKMAEFTVDITKPNGEVAQFGDNDSGRFFKIQPSYNLLTVEEAKQKYLNLSTYNELSDKEKYWDEDFLEHRSLVAGINALFKKKKFFSFVNKPSIEHTLIKNIVKNNIKRYEESISESLKYNVLDVSINEHEKNEINKLEQQEKFVQYIFNSKSNLVEGLKKIAYPDFGMYIFKSQDFYLAIRCGKLGTNGKGSHDHNDQLSIELVIDGEDIIKDPGTYLYTPIPEKRNLFRSTKAHFTIQLGDIEQNNFYYGLSGLFNLEHNTNSQCLEFKNNSFIGCHSGYGQKVYRKIEICDKQVVITDFGTSIVNPEFNYYSNGYGRIIRNK